MFEVAGARKIVIFSNFIVSFRFIIWHSSVKKKILLFYLLSDYTPYFVFNDFKF